ARVERCEVGGRIRNDPIDLAVWPSDKAVQASRNAIKDTPHGGYVAVSYNSSFGGSMYSAFELEDVSGLPVLFYKLPICLSSCGHRANRESQLAVRQTPRSFGLHSAHATHVLPRTKI